MTSKKNRQIYWAGFSNGYSAGKMAGFEEATKLYKNPTLPHIRKKADGSWELVNGLVNTEGVRYSDNTDD